MAAAQILLAPTSGSAGRARGAIAVVGLACRFPGDATDLAGLWNMMAEGRSAWSEIPKSRMNINGYYHPDPNRQGSFPIQGAHFLKEDVAAFDAPFFSISPNEAKAMDPQQRILLEVTYEAMESAGIPREALDGSDTTVWIGSFVKDYEQVCLRDQDNAPQYAATGNGIAILANRISHCYNLTGTSQTIDTGCSASLVCVHQACQSLLSGECSTAIAGGVGLMLTPNTILPMTAMGFLSPDGKSFSFDSRANGYGRGEGAGIVILRRLEDAIANNDTIRGVILSTASNQDGRTAGITLPSMERQAENIIQAYRKAGVFPEKTAFIECHGTGTKAGDVRELQAVHRAMTRFRDIEDPLLVGSIKTNIGHLEGAAGIAGLIKAILVTEKGFIPKHINFEEPNPAIEFSGWRVRVPTELTPWPVKGLRRASVNCFGFGGTNTHAIVEDAAHHLAAAELPGYHGCRIFQDTNTLPRTRQALSGDTPQLFVFSAHEKNLVGAVAKSHASYIRDQIEQSGSNDIMARYAHTLIQRRSRLDWKGYIVSHDSTDLLRKLSMGAVEPTMQSPRGAEIRLAFVFSGQGAQWWAMGRELLEYPVFGMSIAAADSYIRGSLKGRFDLIRELIAAEDESLVDQPLMSQALTTAVQVALVDLLAASNVVPAAVVGHSSGEIAAAYACGAITRESAWRTAYFRGHCIATWQCTDLAPQGRMLAVGLSDQEVQEYLDKVPPGSVRIACYNGPKLVTLSGDADSILEIQKALVSVSVFNRMVQVDTAYHSHHMDEVTDSYRQMIGHVEVNQEDMRATMYSSLTGSEITARDLDANYWVNNLASPVLFHKAMRAMSRAIKPDIIVEVSPQSTWAGTIVRILAAMDYRDPVPCLSVLHWNVNATESTLNLLGDLWVRGCNIRTDWTRSRHGADVDMLRAPQHLYDLPPYPWNHSTKYWSESNISRGNRFRSHGREDLIGAPVNCGIPTNPSWRGFFRISENPWIEDHQVQRSIIYPAAGYITMAIQAAQQLAESSNQDIYGYEVSEFEIFSPIIIPRSTEGVEYTILTRLAHGSPSSSPASLRAPVTHKFTIITKTGSHANLNHAQGLVSIIYASSNENQVDGHGAEASLLCRKYQETKISCGQSLNPRHMYERLDSLGLNYGPIFRNIIAIKKSQTDPRLCHAEVAVPDTKSRMPFGYEFAHIIHPVTLDSIFQTVFALGEDEIMLPCAIKSVFVSASTPQGAGTKFLGYTTAHAAGPRQVSAEITMFGEQVDKPLVVVRGLELKSACPADGLAYLPNHRNLCTEIVWKEDVRETATDNLGTWLDLLGHSIPSLSVLQVGGSAATAVEVLGILEAGYETPRFASYTMCECPEMTILELQKSSLASRVLERVTWDAAPLSAIAPGTCDLIAIHQSRVEDVAMLNSVLTNGGHVIVELDENAYGGLEACFTSLRSMFMNGGFLELRLLTGLGRLPKGQHYIRGRKSPTRAELPSSIGTVEVVIITPHDLSPRVDTLSKAIASHIGGSLAKDCRIVQFSHQLEISGSQAVHISLLETEKPFIFTMSEGQWAAMHNLFRLRNMIWVTGGGQMSVRDPRLAAAIGLARTLRSEDASRRLVSIDIDLEADGDIDTIARGIGSILEGVFIKLTIQKDFEHVLRGGKRFIPRLMTLTVLNSLIEKGNKRPEDIEDFPLWQKHRPLRLSLESVTGNDGLYFEDDLEAARPLGKRDIRVKISTCHLLPNDLEAIVNHSGDGIGSEATGIVVEVGSNVDNCRVGDVVAVIARETVKTSVVVDRKFAWVLSSLATSLPYFSPTATLTAVYGLLTFGQLKKGETILVHAAASAYGQAAVKIAQTKGAVVIAVVSNEGQRHVAQEKLHLPDGMILEADHHLTSGIKRLTNGSGVNVVFNPTPHYIAVNFECCAEYGRVAQVAFKSLESPEMHRAVLKKASFEVFDVWSLAKHRPSGIDEALRQMNCLLSEKGSTILQPDPIHEQHLGDLSAAFKSFAADPYLGMHLLSAGDTARVPIPVKLTKPVRLAAKAAYILVGGFGGIGRAVAQLLVEKGARNIAFLSRSGPTSKEAVHLLDTMKTQGVTTQNILVDICDEYQLKQAVEAVKKVMSPIKGVIQCAAVLQDSTFETMTFSQWAAAFRPKAAGSWNLHRCLPDDMDFFILLSSASGILGNHGQANYAAGNTFQDALAEHRHYLSQRSRTRDRYRHSISLDLGLVLEAGMVAENEHLLDVMLANGFFGMRLADVRYLLERAMAEPARVETQPTLRLPPQVVTALGTGGLTLQNGTSSPHWTSSALFEYLNRVDLPAVATCATTAATGAVQSHSKEGDRELYSQVRAAASQEEADSIAIMSVARSLGRFMGMSPPTGTGGMGHARGGSGDSTNSGGNTEGSSSNSSSSSDLSGGRRTRRRTITGVAAVLDVSRSTASNGVDSLVKLSITKWIVNQTGVAVGDIDDFNSIREIGKFISKSVRAADANESE